MGRGSFIKLLKNLCKMQGYPIACLMYCYSGRQLFCEESIVTYFNHSLSEQFVSTVLHRNYPLTLRKLGQNPKNHR